MRAAPIVLLLLTLAGCADFKFFEKRGLLPPPQPIVDRAQLQSALGESPTTPKSLLNESSGRQQMPDIAPSALAGAPASQVAGWMGEPDAIWSESGNAIWRYASGECVVLLFVRPDNRVDEVRILRQDGAGSEGCSRAITNRISAQTS